MTRPLNFLVFFTDQQRWDCSGLHGNPLDLMPNFDTFARRHTHLQYFFTPQPVCGPARSCLQSGQYATRTGCFRNGIPLPRSVPTVAKVLRDGGYHTGYIGKWHLADGDGPVEVRDRGGYDYWLASNVLEFTSDAYQTTLFDSNGQPVHLPGYRADALTDAAIRFLDANRRRPFFLTVSYVEPHFQNHRDDYPAPFGYTERYIGRWLPPDLQALGGTAPQHWGGYCGMVKRLDECFGRLNDALYSLDLHQNTVVVFLSDHGCHFKTRNQEYKRSAHESSIRIPGAIGGGPFVGGGALPQLVSLLDIPPTIIDASDLPVPETMQGRSLLPLVNGTATDWPGEVFAQISESEVGRCVRTHRWKYAVRAPLELAGDASAADLYDEVALFDLFADPYELTNLIGYESHAAVAARMRCRLLKRMAEVGEDTPEIRLAASIPSGQRRVSERAIEA